MPSVSEQPCFSSIHIDVARNATDDFNPFHDKHRWQNVVGNPFSGPIILGFQMECFIEDRMRHYRSLEKEEELLSSHNLRFSNYDFKFVNAVLPEQYIELVTKNSKLSRGENFCLSNRVALKANGRTVLLGFKRETQSPLAAVNMQLPENGCLDDMDDRSYLSGTSIFLKRKYLTTSNAKNFLCGSLVEPAQYIDEIAEKIRFPETYPCALLSSALLERAWDQGHDFEQEPLVYLSHSLSIDRLQLAKARSNEVLHLLSQPISESKSSPIYDCLGVLGNKRPLFTARISLARLKDV
ncbi:MAG: hypothetical protein AAF699_00370 [Pseudomonadota bacterium]